MEGGAVRFAHGRCHSTGATDLRDALERVLPSLNHAAFAGDYGALTDTVQLRGLSPDHVLILINGKRRHTTANIYTAGGPLQGSAPVDLDLIPLSAIDHIEVLRDGAAAMWVRRSQATGFCMSAVTIDTTITASAPARTVGQESSIT